MKTIKSYEAAQPQKNVDKIVVNAKSVEFETDELRKAYEEDDRGPDKVVGSSNLRMFINLIVYRLLVIDYNLCYTNHLRESLLKFLNQRVII